MKFHGGISHSPIPRLRIGRPGCESGMHRALSPAAGGSQRGSRPSRRACSVLLADDHPTNRLLLVRQLNTLGYAAETAEDGVIALQKWKTGRYAILITDCHMPEMDGYDLTRAIRAHRGAERRAPHPDHRLHRQCTAGRGRNLFRRGHGRLHPEAGGNAATCCRSWIAGCRLATAKFVTSGRGCCRGRAQRRPDRAGAAGGNLRRRQGAGTRNPAGLSASRTTPTRNCCTMRFAQRDAEVRAASGAPHERGGPHGGARRTRGCCASASSTAGARNNGPSCSNSSRAWTRNCSG